MIRNLRYQKGYKYAIIIDIMAKKSAKKYKKLSNKKRLLFIQAFATLLVAVYIIMSAITVDKTVTGNVVNSINEIETSQYKIFIFLGIAIGIFSFIEIAILFVVTYM